MDNLRTIALALIAIFGAFFAVAAAAPVISKLISWQSGLIVVALYLLLGLVMALYTRLMHAVLFSTKLSDRITMIPLWGIFPISWLAGVMIYPFSKKIRTELKKEFRDIKGGWQGYRRSYLRRAQK